VTWIIKKEGATRKKKSTLPESLKKVVHYHHIADTGGFKKWFLTGVKEEGNGLLLRGKKMKNAIKPPEVLGRTWEEKGLGVRMTNFIETMLSDMENECLGNTRTVLDRKGERKKTDC